MKTHDKINQLNIANKEKESLLNVKIMEFEMSKKEENLLNELSEELKKILQIQIDDNKLMSAEKNELELKYNDLDLKLKTNETNISNQTKQLK